MTVGGRDDEPQGHERRYWLDRAERNGVERCGLGWKRVVVEVGAGVRVAV